MCADDPISEIRERRLCFECVAEEFLREKIKEIGSRKNCFYCERQLETLSVQEIAELVNSGILVFFVKYDAELQAALDQFANERGEKPQPRGRPVAEVIKEQASVGEVVAEDIRGVLAKHHEESPDEEDQMTRALEMERWQNPFDTQARYVPRDSVDGWEFESHWRHFERSLIEQTRHFNRTGAAILTAVFEGIDELLTTNGRAVDRPRGAGYRTGKTLSGARLPIRGQS
jgi:hypothetical protein